MLTSGTTFAIANHIRCDQLAREGVKSARKQANVLRRQIYELVEGEGTTARVYSIAMIFIIIASLLPLCFKDDDVALNTIEYTCAVIFIVDYLLRLITADLKLGEGSESFFLYPMTPMAIIDLLSIVPTFFGFNDAMKALRIVRLIRIARIFKLFRYLREATPSRGCSSSTRSPCSSSRPRPSGT